MNEDKAKELQAEAEAAMVMHQSNMDSQVSKRKARMEKRLKAKRAQKQLALQRKHEEEQARELAAQEEERKKLDGMSSREREMKMLEGIMVRGAVSFKFSRLCLAIVCCRVMLEAVVCCFVVSRKKNTDEISPFPRAPFAAILPTSSSRIVTLNLLE